MGLGAGDSIISLLIAVAICMALGLVNYTGYAVAFSFSGVMTSYKRLRRWIDSVVAGLFAIAGIGLIRSAFSR